jgi:hypothetical protein
MRYPHRYSESIAHYRHKAKLADGIVNIRFIKTLFVSVRYEARRLLSGSELSLSGSIALYRVPA